MARHDFEQSLQQHISDPYQQANTISSLPFSCLICAKRRSRWPRFDTSHYTPVTFLPISLTATVNSGSRRSVMKMYAPSFTNRFAVARPMPLLPPVSQCVFRSGLPIYFTSVVSTTTCDGRSTYLFLHSSK